MPDPGGETVVDFGGGAEFGEAVVSDVADSANVKCRAVVAGVGGAEWRAER